MNMVNTSTIVNPTEVGGKNQGFSEDVNGYLDSLDLASPEELQATVHEVAGYVQNNIGDISRDEANALQSVLLEKAAGTPDVGPALDLLREKGKTPFPEAGVAAEEESEQVKQGKVRADQLATMVEVETQGLEFQNAKSIKVLEAKVKTWKAERDQLPGEVTNTNVYKKFSTELDKLDIAVLKKSILL